MKISDLPSSGSFKQSKFNDFTWEHIPGYPNGLRVNKAAECENPEYEADIYFPDGVIDFDNMDGCTINMASIDQNGGESGLDDDWCHDTFYPLFDFLNKEYGNVKANDFII